MRLFVSLLPVVFTLAALPADAGELTFMLDSNTGSGYATNQTPDADLCVSPNCVLFTGTITDNDIDAQPNDVNPSLLYLTVPYTGGAGYTGDPSQSVFDGLLYLDNTAPPGIFSGDTLYATDGLGNYQNSYSGPIFGVDIPVGTVAGIYQDTVYLDYTPYTYDPVGMTYDTGTTVTVSETVTVDVTPEPSAGILAFAGFAMLAVFGVRRKWLSFEASR